MENNVMRLCWLAGFIVILLGGCQSYAPKPLDPVMHRSLWEARTHDPAVIQELVRAMSAEQASNSAAFSLDDGLSLAEGEVLALMFNPDVRMARADAAVALAAAEYAGLWDDPSLSFDAMRVIESVPKPWVIGGMAGFVIPISGRLAAERSLANAEHQAAITRVLEHQWQVRTELRTTWMQWSASRLQIELLEDLLDREQTIVEVVDRLESAGSLSRLEGRLFRMERASRTSELLLLRSHERELAMRLRGMMGLLPAAAMEFEPHVAIDRPAPTDDAFTRIDQHNPSLQAHRREYDIAEHALQLEIRKQYPDIEIGPAYEREDGMNKLGLGLNLPLPLWNANRQAIAIAHARREAARIRYEATHERLVSEFAQAASQHEAGMAARQSIEQELLPLAEAQIVDERRIAELGELNVLLTLESVVRAHETRVRLIEARLAESLAAIRIEHVRGPDHSSLPLQEVSTWND